MSVEDSGAHPLSQYFSRPRDAALHMMWEEMWSNESSGSLDSPSGRFARISNYPEDLPGIDDAFREDFAVLNVSPLAVLGHFVLRQSSVEEYGVDEYPSERHGRAAYAILLQVFEDWEREL